MNLLQIRTFARALLSEPTASYWSDAELNSYINLALEDICTKTDVLEDISTYSLIQYQGDYALPTDYTKVKRVEIIKGSSVYELYPADLDEMYQGFVRTTSSPPRGYGLWEGNIRLTERPSTAATADALDADITAAATTISLADTSSLPKTGRVIIDSEVIEYMYNDTENNDLEVCTRGMEGTTAAAHSSAAVVTLRDMWVYHFKKDAELTSDTGTPTIPTQFHQVPAYYCASIARHKHKDYDLADKYMAEYEKKLLEIYQYVKYRWARRRKPK